MTKWNHNCGRQLRLLMQHLEAKQPTDSAVADAEDMEHIRQVNACARCRTLRWLTLTLFHLTGAGVVPHEWLLHQLALHGHAAPG